MKATDPPFSLPMRSDVFFAFFAFDEQSGDVHALGVNHMKEVSRW
jgi:hypothetical protein